MFVVLAYVICALVWGTTWFAIRVCIGDGGYPTFEAAAIRFTIASLILIPLFFSRIARPGPARRREWVALIAAGVLNSLGYSLVYLGEESVSGGIAAVLFGTEPLAVALMVTLTRTERVTPAQLIGAFIALGGIGIIFLDRMDVSAAQAVGVGMILAAVIVSGVLSVIVKRQAGKVNPLASAAVFLTVTAAVSWITVFVAGREPLPASLPVAPTIALAYLGVFGSVVAFVFYFYLVKRVTLMTLSSLVFILPIIAIAVDAMWEDEVRLAARTYVGIGTTLAGVLVSLYLKKPAPPAPAATPAANPAAPTVVDSIPAYEQ